MDERSTCPDIVAQHIRAVTEEFTNREMTPRQVKASLILARCLQGAATYGSTEYVSPFYEGNSHGCGLWATGDLDGGTGGRQFIYAYLPTRFAETLMDGVEDLPDELAEILSTAAMVYFTNTLRSALDETITNLLYEAGTVMTELVNSLAKPVKARIENGATPVSLDFDQERFNKMIDTIITEGNQRRRVRVREAMSEVDPRRRLEALYRHYLTTEPAWNLATNIYKANKARRPWKNADWKNAIKVEVQTEYGIALDDNLVSLLSDNPKDRLLTPPDNFETTPSGLALEHAAQMCGLPPFSRSTGHLRALKCAQEKATPRNCT